MENINQELNNKIEKKRNAFFSFSVSKNFIILLPIVLVLTIFLFRIILSFMELSVNPPTPPLPVIEGQYITSPTPEVFRTYTNEKYGFKLKYPAKGVIQIEDEEVEGACGNAIKENAEGVLVDNFFQIKIIDWKGTIDDYIIQRGAKKTYDFEPITNSNADEAVKVLGIKKGMELVSVGFPPLMYIEDIYKKSDKLFIFEHTSHPPHPSNPNGCLNPKDIDPIKYKKYVDEKWEIPTSFKFLNPAEKKKIIWNVPSKQIPKSLEIELKSALSALDSNPNKNENYLNINSAQVSTISANWVTLGYSEENDSSLVKPSGSGQYLLYKNQNKWVGVRDWETNFCDIMKQAPKDLQDFDYYIGCK